MPGTYTANLPSDLRAILLDFTISCLVENPDDYVEHGCQYFARLLQCRSQIRSSAGYEDIEKPPNLAFEELARKRKTVKSGERYDPTIDGFSLHSIIIPKNDLDRNELMKDIKDVLIFRGLGTEKMSVIMNAMFPKFVESGEVVITQGDTAADWFFVVDEGIFEAIVETDSGNVNLVRAYNNNGSFGELALLYNTPRAATVRAITNGKLWVLDRDTFVKIVVQFVSEKRTRYETLIEKVEFLKVLTSYEKMDLADSLEPRNFDDGEAIFYQGAIADGMYFIESGKVKGIMDHHTNGRVVICELGPGDYLGELALITNKPRALSAFAIGETRLAFLDKQTFELLLGPCMELLQERFANYETVLSNIIGPS